MKAVHQILIVEDHTQLRGLLSFLLSSAGYQTRETADAVSARAETNRQQPDLVLLDWQLPDMDGLQLLQHWRASEATAQMPVIMVTGKTGESDRVAGLSAGADDYISKPFGRHELLARVQAVLRRSTRSQTKSELRHFNGLTLDVLNLRLSAAGKTVHLGPIEFKMLNLFMSHPDRAMTRAQICARVWPSNAHVDERTVDVHIRRLRMALRPSGHHDCIQTVRSVGYRLSQLSPVADRAP